MNRQAPVRCRTGRSASVVGGETLSLGDDVVIEVKSTDQPDERREFPRGHLDVLELPGLSFGATPEPGWRWSESVRPIAGTDSCQVPHTGYVLRGRLRALLTNLRRGIKS